MTPYRAPYRRLSVSVVMATLAFLAGAAAAPAPAGAAGALTAAAGPAGAPAAAARRTPPYAITDARTPASASVVLGSQLTRGQSLGPGDSLRSANTRYSLVVGTDGTLTYQQAPNRLNPQPFAQLLAGSSSALRLDLQTDGNLVLYTSANLVVRNYGTAGSTAERLVLQDDGNLVLYGTGDAVILDFALSTSGFLQAGQVLLPGDSVRSRTSSSRLDMQRDGNLVLYTGATALFSTGTYGHPGAAAIQQSDGNFVVYSATSPPVALFSTATSNGNGAFTFFALLQDEFKILGSGEAIVSLYGSAWSRDAVTSGQFLFPGDRRTSPGRRCLLVLQTDGNLVDYCDGQVAFTTRTSGIGLAFMSPTGEFSLLESPSPTGDPALVFRTGTGGYPGSRLVVQDDRNLVVYTPDNRAVFRTR